MYARIYKKYSELNWLKDPLGLFVKMRLNRMFGPQFLTELDELHRERFPDQSEVEYSNLPSDLIESIRTKWQRRAIIHLATKRNEWKFYDRALTLYAQTCDLTPTSETQRLATSSTSAYRSQGWGARKYARAIIKIKADLLEENGFSTNIIELNFDYGVEFELWANATPCQLEALMRLESLDDWVQRYKDTGVNPRVYNPWID